MFQKNLTYLFKIGVIFASFLLTFTLTQGKETKTWQIYLSKAQLQDQAIQAALEDLENASSTCGLSFKVVLEDTATMKDDDLNAIVVGTPERNKITGHLVNDGFIQLQRIEDNQGYTIITKNLQKSKIIVVAGGSLIGDVYGLYWIWDRIRVFKDLPDLTVHKVPDLKIRFIHAGSKEDIRNALRYGATWVWGGSSINHLIPWNIEPERTENEKNRAEIRALINYAHSLHLKFFVYEDEFSYHPSLLKEFYATLSPDDPAFWDAVQAKYRRLLQALPEVDGIRIRTGEATRVGGNFKAFDVMHEGEGCDWSLAKRYRTFVKKIYNVVVGEFAKIYYQRTWVTNAHEQHSMASVYKDIFTDDVPIQNLYLSPYLSTTDRYFHQPYNPTFNQTPHQMIVLLATLDYHGGVGDNIFPTFPGQYFQGGLKTILAPENSNVMGVDFGAAAIDNWDTRGVTAYTVARLVWDHKESLKTIARDFAAIYFGQAAAEQMANIYLLSPNAYKYGIYIEPVSYGDFNSLPHLRLTTFPAKGFPHLDNGRKHLEFLYTIYLRCQPWINETNLYLDYGLEIANSMVEKFKPVQPLLIDDKLAWQVKNSIDLSYQLIKTNNLYVKTIFSYFDYREQPTEDHKNLLTRYSTELKNSMQQFLATPGCVYRLDGMEQLLKNVNQALENLPKAEEMLANAPNEEGIKRIIAEQQEKYAQILTKYSKNAIKVLHWKGRVDGKDLIKITGKELEVEHIQYDPIAEMSYQFSSPLPGKAVTVVPVNIQSRSFGPFMLEQPTQENNYTATVYLSDFPYHGYSWWEFDLYYITKPPSELGLIVPWQH